MIYIKEKVDEVLFSDTAEIIFLLYGAILAIISLLSLLDIFVFDIIPSVWENNLRMIFALCVLPYLIYLLYYLIAPTIGDHE